MAEKSGGAQRSMPYTLPRSMNPNVYESTISVNDGSNDHLELSLKFDMNRSQASQNYGVSTINSTTMPIKLPNGPILPAGTIFESFNNSDWQKAAESKNRNTAIFQKRYYDPNTFFPSYAPILGQNSNSFESYNPLYSGRNSPLIKPMEMQSMGLFFDTEIVNSQSPADLLFDSTEQQFLSDFLNGFLVDDDLANEADIVKNPQTTSVSSESESIRSLNVVDNTRNSLSYHTTLSVPSNPTNYKRKLEDIKSTSNDSVPPGDRLHQDLQLPSDSRQNFTAETPSSLSTDKAVPIPVLAPRKKRHKSKELLTADEKRANHIASEQKRRQNIRLGFEALSRLVPEISRATATQIGPKVIPSKATILEKTIEFIRYLEKRNQKLKSRETSLLNLYKSHQANNAST